MGPGRLRAPRVTRSMQLTRFDERLVTSSALPAWVSVGLTAAGLLSVFVLDRATGSAPVQHLYYLPIILAGIRFRLRGGLLAATAAVLLYHAANPHLWALRYGESDLVQMVLFFAVGVITARMALDAARLRHLAGTDDLTGLQNLRSFEAGLATLIRTARQSRATLALLALDVDRLKTLNDHYGHLAGAESVRTVGEVVARELPAGAIACRYGGDEFIIAAPACDRANAVRLAADLCHSVNDVAPVLAGHAFPSGTLSVSVGAFCLSFGREGTPRSPSLTDAALAEVLFREADAALYRAKAEGRNRVSVA
jgi:diguanylate cyclase (GGDEF)-like protein